MRMCGYKSRRTTENASVKPVIYCLADHKRLRARCNIRRDNALRGATAAVMVHAIYTRTNAVFVVVVVVDTQKTCGPVDIYIYIFSYVV